MNPKLRPVHFRDRFAKFAAKRKKLFETFCPVSEQKWRFQAISVFGICPKLDRVSNTKSELRVQTHSHPECHGGGEAYG